MLTPHSHAVDDLATESIASPKIQDTEHDSYRETPMVVPRSPAISDLAPETIALPKTPDPELGEYRDHSITMEEHLHPVDTHVLAPHSYTIGGLTSESIASPRTPGQDLESYEDLQASRSPAVGDLAPEAIALPRTPDLELGEYRDSTTTVEEHLHHDETRTLTPHSYTVDSLNPEPATTVKEHLVHHETPVMVPLSDDVDKLTPEPTELPEPQEMEFEEYPDHATTIERHDQETPTSVPTAHELATESMAISEASDEEYHAPSTTTEMHLRDQEAPVPIPASPGSDRPAPVFIALPKTPDFELEDYHDSSTAVEMHLRNQETPTSVPPSHTFDELAPESPPSLEIEEYLDPSSTIETHLHDQETPISVPASRSLDGPVPESIALPETPDLEREEYHDPSTAIEMHPHDQEIPALLPPSHTFNELAPESTPDLESDEYLDPSTMHLHDQETPISVPTSRGFDGPAPESIALPNLELEEYHDPSTATETHPHDQETPALPLQVSSDPAPESVALSKTPELDLEENVSTAIEKHLPHDQRTPELMPPPNVSDVPALGSIALSETSAPKSEEYQSPGAIESHLHQDQTTVLMPPPHGFDGFAPDSAGLPGTSGPEFEEYRSPSATVERDLEVPVSMPPSHDFNELTPESIALPRTPEPELEDYRSLPAVVETHLPQDQETPAPPSHTSVEPAPESMILSEAPELELEEYKGSTTASEKHLDQDVETPVPESELEESRGLSRSIETHIPHDQEAPISPPLVSDEPIAKSIALPKTPELDRDPSATIDMHLPHDQETLASMLPSHTSAPAPLLESSELDLEEYQGPSTNAEWHLREDKEISVPASPPHHDFDELAPESIALPKTPEPELEEHQDPSTAIQMHLHDVQKSPTSMLPLQTSEPASETIALPQTQDLDIEEYRDPMTTIKDHLHSGETVGKEAMADQQAERAVETRDFAEVPPEDLEPRFRGSTSDEPVLEPQQSEREVVETLSPQIADTGVEDEWAETPLKRGKKGSKKRKNSKQAPSRMPAGVVMPQSKEASISDIVSAEDTSATTTPAPEQELNIDKTPAKRKRKKGNRASVTSTPSVTAAESTPVASQESLPEMDLDDTPVQRADDIALLPAGEADPEDEWATSSKKKGKRGSKQAKKISLPSTPPVIEEVRKVVAEGNVLDALDEAENERMMEDSRIDEPKSAEPQPTYPEQSEANMDRQSVPLTDNVENFVTPVAVLAVTGTAAAVAEMLRKEKESENKSIVEPREADQVPEPADKDEGILEMQTRSIERTEPESIRAEPPTPTNEPLQKELEQVEDIEQTPKIEEPEIPLLPQEVDPEEMETNKSKQEKEGKKSSASSKTASRIASPDRLMSMAADGSENLAEDTIPRAPFVESMTEVPASEAASFPLPSDDRDELEQVQADRDDMGQPVEPYAEPTAEESGAQSANRAIADTQDLSYEPKESPRAADIESTQAAVEESHQQSFDPALVLADPLFSRPSSRAGVLEEPYYDELPLLGSKRPSRRPSRRASRRASVDVLAHRQSPTRDTESDSRPPPTNDKEFAELLATGLQGAGFDPNIVREDKSYAERLSPEHQTPDDEPEGFSELHRRAKKGVRSRTTSPPKKHVATGLGEASKLTRSAEPYFEAPMTAEPEELDVTKDVEDPSEKPIATESEAMERNLPVEATAEDEWAVPVKKGAKKHKKGSKSSMETLDQQTEESPKDRGIKDALLGAAAVGAAGVIAASMVRGKDRQGSTTQEPSVADPGQREIFHSKVHTKSLPRRRSTEIISPTSTGGQRRSVSELFPGLERVKRKIPERQDSISEQQPTKRPSLGSGEAAVERLMSPRPSISHLSAKGPIITKQVSAQDLAKPTWSWPEPENRDSAVVIESPAPPSTHEQGVVRDSGYHDLPMTSDEQIKEHTSSHESQESPIEHDSPVRDDPARESIASADSLPRATPRSWQRAPPSPPAIESTSKDRSSLALFESSPSAREPPSFGIASDESFEPTPTAMDADRDMENFVDNSTSIFGQQDMSEAPYIPMPTSHTRSPSMPLDTILEASPESPLAKKSRPLSDLGEPDHGTKAPRRSETPESIAQKRQASLHIAPPEVSERAFSPASMVSMGELIDNRAWPEIDEEHGTVDGIERALQDESRRTPSSGHTPILGRKVTPFSDRRSPSILSDKSMGRIKSPDHIRSASVTSNRSERSLRRVDMSGDLRAASRLSGAGVRVSSTPQPQTPTLAGASTNERLKGIGRRISMEGVFEGLGDAPGPPMSPTGRPPSVRKRQSLQILDMEARIEHLTTENRSLLDAKAKAEAANLDYGNDRELHAATLRQATEAVASRDALIQEKEAEIAQIRELIQRLHEEVDRLAGENARLTAQNQSIATDAQRFADLQSQSAEVHQKWQESERSLSELRTQYDVLSSGMERIVREELDANLKDRDDEIQQLRQELNTANQHLQNMQQELNTAHQDLQNMQQEMVSKQVDDFLTVRSEDYIESACQQLCLHVQQWVLRFSKFSDNRACRLSSDIQNDKIDAMLDNVMLDGSDVDSLLGDRVRRRDVFMSIVMSIIWEYVFSRYLFGLDREQRQKLKALEGTLKEIGPQRAVAQWRAITLTLLSRREVYIEERTQNTEAVVNEIYTVLATLLPPPSHLRNQILESLRNVMRLAVNLSIDMRCQRPEYIMLRPLRPEYDPQTGELSKKVQFNSDLMNERSGQFSSNEEVEDRQADVKIGLFPLVIKKGDDLGEGDEETIICPAQVIAAKPNDSKKVVRVLSGAMDIDSRQSLTSVARAGSTRG